MLNALGGTLKITEVDAIRVRVPGFSPPYRWRRGLPGSAGDGYSAVLRIRTDEGVDGVAFSVFLGGGSALPDLVDRVLREQLVGEDPLQREWIWHMLWELDRVE